MMNIIYIHYLTGSQKEINKLHKRKVKKVKDMRNIKYSISTTDMIIAINVHCRSAIENYKNGNVAWKVDVNIAKVCPF